MSELCHAPHPYRDLFCVREPHGDDVQHATPLGIHPEYTHNGLLYPSQEEWDYWPAAPQQEER